MCSFLRIFSWNDPYVIKDLRELGMHIFPTGLTGGAYSLYGVYWGCPFLPWGQLGMHILPMASAGDHKFVLKGHSIQDLHLDDSSYTLLLRF